MASHGISRLTSTEQKSEEARKKEKVDIVKYRQLVDLVNQKVREGEFSVEILGKISELLKRNPEYYTVWNHRRRVLLHLFEGGGSEGGEGESSSTAPGDERRQQLIESDLQFLFPLLLQFPKCYWIWNYRLWLLERTTELLPGFVAERLWQEELGLVGKMLNRDSRNFHGWGYRRTVVASLERMTSRSMAQEEFDYTTKMIKTNLSNFSAWHQRTKLLIRLLNERSATDVERRRRLDEELRLIHRALIDPYDQSLWSYHRNLMCSFDPAVARETLAPNLTNTERLAYLADEHDFLEEILDGAEDCALIYQALIECALLAAKIEGSVNAERRLSIKRWLVELRKLDPLRRGRWVDFEMSLIV